VDVRPVLLLKTVDLALLTMDGEVNDSLFLELDPFFIDNVVNLLSGVQDEEGLLHTVAFGVVLNVLTVCFKRDNRTARQLEDFFLRDFASFGAVLLKFEHLLSVSGSLSKVNLLAISADQMSLDHVFGLARFIPRLLLV
jgi:hypothetical protein